MRKTKIVCTLGPAVDSTESLRALMTSGMNCARFNFSHGTHASHLAMLNRFKAVRDDLGWPVATMLDTKGPEIRIKKFSDGSVQLNTGCEFTLTSREIEGNEKEVSITYKELPQEVRPGTRILIDDGIIGLKVKAVKGEDILCTVESGGMLSDDKGVSVPNTPIHLPFLSERDIGDLKFAVENDFDFISASFVRSADDVRQIREILQKYGGNDIQIIAKLENQQSVDNLDEIIAASDGIMVARGDLGVQIPLEKVPVVQKEIICKCQEAGKLVITATQMLDSMIRNPRPTRAEVSDVANAVFDGTDCVMLSGETASGKYPIESLKTMVTVVTEAESSIDYWTGFNRMDEVEKTTINDAITHSCCLAARDLNAAAILCASKTGHTARMIARFRPQCPIVAMTMSEKARRQLALVWSVHPALTGVVDTTDRLFSVCEEAAYKNRFVENGDVVVITAGVPIGKAGSTNLIKADTVHVNPDLGL
jgi:pyruvate kinase